MAQPGLARHRRVHPPERVPQEVELPVWIPADPCLLFVYRQLQLAHARTQVVERWFGAPPPAQDHKIVRIGGEASTEAVPEPELLPPQHKPAHVKIRQQW